MKTYDDSVNSFLKNESSIMGYTSGFWAQDPIGDLQMYFTPGLHPVLAHVTNDKHLQKMLSDLDETDDADIPKKLEEINRYLFEKGVTSAYAHVRKFYVAKNEGLISEPAFALSSPAPWQMFRIAK